MNSDALFRNYYRPLCIYALHYLLDVEQVEDVKKNSQINVFLKKMALEQKAAYEEVRNNTEGPQYYLVVTDLQVYNENLRDVKNQCVL